MSTDECWQRRVSRVLLRVPRVMGRATRLPTGGSRQARSQPEGSIRGSSRVVEAGFSTMAVGAFALPSRRRVHMPAPVGGQLKRTKTPVHERQSQLSNTGARPIGRRRDDDALPLPASSRAASASPLSVSSRPSPPFFPHESPSTQRCNGGQIRHRTQPGRKRGSPRDEWTTRELWVRTFNEDGCGGASRAREE